MEKVSTDISRRVELFKLIKMLSYKDNH
ncbi:hypothetical protein H1P_10011 [Hyella patelloides LEGE 07179]|uniref:Uncharacterized protein n=1 Tax=Hyella patelloides LEGE 07179 TaxID=945734 RepID=A0A563VIH6_9CYAN|nr:hypothetical protein H1P_10011 [Hyella patelloides LEGE 07179]